MKKIILFLSIISSFVAARSPERRFCKVLNVLFKNSDSVSVMLDSAKRNIDDCFYSYDCLVEEKSMRSFDQQDQEVLDIVNGIL